MVQALRGKIGAARIALENARSETEKLVLSKSHASAIEEYTRRLTQNLASEDVLALQNLALKASWCGDDLVKVTTAIAARTDGTGRTRRHSQDFRTFITYLDKTLWDELLSERPIGAKDWRDLPILITPGPPAPPL